MTFCWLSPARARWPKPGRASARRFLLVPASRRGFETLPINKWSTMKYISCVLKKVIEKQNGDLNFKSPRVLLSSIWIPKWCYLPPADHFSTHPPREFNNRFLNDETTTTRRLQYCTTTTVRGGQIIWLKYWLLTVDCLSSHFCIQIALIVDCWLENGIDCWLLIVTVSTDLTTGDCWLLIVDCWLLIVAIIVDCWLLIVTVSTDLTVPIPEIPGRGLLILVYYLIY